MGLQSLTELECSVPELTVEPWGSYIYSQSCLFPRITAQPIDAKHGYTNAHMLTYVKHLKRIVWVHKVYLWEKGSVPHDSTCIEFGP